MTRSEWVIKQLTSWQNISSVLSLLGFLTYLFVFNYHPTTVVIFFALFFLATAWRMLAMMLVFSLIAFGIVSLLPFLAPVAFIIMLGLFLARIGFVLKNWRAVISGLLVYGLAYILYDEDGIDLLDPIYKAGAYLITSVPTTWFGGLQLGLFYECFQLTFTACVIAFFFQSLLYWQYRNGYTATGALNIMGSIPLVIIALILPFLKLVSADGMVADGAGGDYMHQGDFAPEGDAVHDTAIAHDSYMSHDGYISNEGYAGHDGYVKAPSGYHHVNAYERISPTGEIEHVNGYIRSNPDGIVENNLSYHGEHGYNGESNVPGYRGEGSYGDGQTIDAEPVFEDVPYVMVNNTYSSKLESFLGFFSPKKHIFLTLIAGFLSMSLLLTGAIYSYFAYTSI